MPEDAYGDAVARQGIRDLYARYCFALDSNDAEALAECFTDDGVFALSDRGDFVGRDQIVGLIAKTRSGRPRHHALNIEVLSPVGKGQYRSRAYFILLDQGTAAVEAYGEYADACTLGEDSVWRFARRDVEFLWRNGQYAERAADATS